MRWIAGVRAWGACATGRSGWGALPRPPASAPLKPRPQPFRTRPSLRSRMARRDGRMQRAAEGGRDWGRGLGGGGVVAARRVGGGVGRGEGIGRGHSLARRHSAAGGHRHLRPANTSPGTAAVASSCRPHPCSAHLWRPFTTRRPRACCLLHPHRHLASCSLPHAPPASGFSVWG